MTTTSRLTTLAALATAAFIALVLVAPATAATHRCSFQANATGIVVRNVGCPAGRRVINAYGQRFTTHHALGYYCKVVQLDRNDNPVVRCVRFTRVVLWHAV